MRGTRGLRRRRGAQVKIEIYPGESLFKATEQWQALERGQLDISAFPRDYSTGKYPAFGATLMPGLVKNHDHAKRLNASPILFGYMMSNLRVTQAIAESIVSLGLNPWVLMLWINVFLLVLGCFLPPAAIILMTTPIILPIIVRLGFDPVWFGVILTINMELGLITPPVGRNLYVINGSAPRVRLGTILRVPADRDLAARHRDGRGRQSAASLMGFGSIDRLFLSVSAALARLHMAGRHPARGSALLKGFLAALADPGQHDQQG